MTLNGRTPGFRRRYESAVKRNDSLLCVGLDPDPDQIPPNVEPVDFLKNIIDATSDLVCCYKPNSAFFESAGTAGLTSLQSVIDGIPDEIPILLDAKRADIGNSSTFYAHAVFEQLGVDAVTVSPYLGEDGLVPFFNYRNCHSFVLCRTSNPSAGDLQDLTVAADGRPLYEHVALLANSWNQHENVGLVVGATYPSEAAHIRELCPDLLFLVPGVGAQSGDLERAVQATSDSSGGGLILNSSRGILYASQSGSDGGYVESARRAAIDLRDNINEARNRTH